MSPPTGHIHVDPEGVKRVGKAYHEHAQYYDQQLLYVQDLRSTYDGCWGDDDMGREFSTSFLAGLDGAEAVLKGGQAHVRYAADTLIESGADYRDTEDGAVDAGTRLIALAEPGAPPPVTPGPPPEAAPANQRPPAAADGSIPSQHFGTPQTPGLPAQGGPGNLSLSADATAGTTPLSMRTGLLPSEPSEAPQPTIAPGTPNNLSVSHGPGPGSETTEEEALAPVHTAAPLHPGHEPAGSDVQTPAAGTTPAGSGHVGTAEVPDAHLDGRPLDKGFRIVALTPEPDGTVVFDANRYDSVTPVSRSAVSDAQGQPIPGDDVRFFVVQENPHVDPAAPDYRGLPIAVQPAAD